MSDTHYSSVYVGEYLIGGGNFWFIGRDDDVIKASGYRIGLFEV